MIKPTNSKQLKRKSTDLIEKLEALSTDVQSYVSAALNISETLEAEKNKRPYPGLNFISIRDAIYDIANEKNRDWIL